MLSCSPRCWRWWIFVRESCARRMNGAEFRIHCNITSSPLCSSHRARQQPKERACGTIIRISLQIIVSFLTYQHQRQQPWQHKRNVFRKVSFAGSCLSARNLLWFVKIKFVFDSSCLPLLRIWVWCPPRGKVWKVQHACNLAALQTDNLNRWWKRKVTIAKFSCYYPSTHLEEQQWTNLRNFPPLGWWCTMSLVADFKPF